MKLTKAIDLKHHVEVEVSDDFRDGGSPLSIRIVKSGNGVPIPNEEPTILFRGRDRLAVPMLEHYRELCRADGCNDWQLAQVDELIGRFRVFAETSPTMKQPGITRGA
jgi:hypothetical protein